MNQEEQFRSRKPGMLTIVGHGLCAALFLALAGYFFAMLITDIGPLTRVGSIIVAVVVGLPTSVVLFSLIFLVGYRVSELKDTVQRLEIKVNQLADQLGQQGPAS
jgi:hypothetical protein